MIPVLAVKDPVAARRSLTEQFGFLADAAGQLRFGDAAIAVLSADALPADLIALPLDHVAFRVPDADDCWRRFSAAGAAIDPRFTPDGPRDIAEFWEKGVRFVFFAGPGAAPFEFCARNGQRSAVGNGHSHFAIRTPDPDGAAARLSALGAVEVARHVLAGAAGPVSVRFLQRADDMFEIFDEAPFGSDVPLTGWVGLLPG